MKYGKAIFLTLNFLFFTVLLATLSSHAEIPSKLEPDYADAILAIRNNDFGNASAILDRLLQIAPDSIEFLELKAITLKSTDQSVNSLKAYLNLIELKKNTPDVAPYHFEAGTLYYKKQEYDSAIEHFNASLKHGYNNEASNFYLGLCLLSKAEYQKAESYFLDAIQGNTKALVPAAYLYLAQVYVQAKYPAGASQALILAKNTAREVLNQEDSSDEARTIAKQSYTQAVRALKPLDRNLWFGHLSFATELDTNVPTLPNTVDGNQISNKRSINNQAELVLGYLTSSIKTIQWIPAIRSNINYQLNRNAKSYEYFNQSASLFVMAHSLSKTSYGIKADGSYSLKNQASSKADSSVFKAYSHHVGLGPYFRHFFVPKHALGFEGSFKYTFFYDDKTTSNESKRSSDTIDGILFYQFENGSGFFNPSISLGYGVTSTKGVVYDENNIDIDFKNSLYFTDRLRTQLKIGLQFKEYPTFNQGETPLARKDTLLTIALKNTMRVGRFWSIDQDTQWQTNASTKASAYSYERLNVKFGMSYSFL